MLEEGAHGGDARARGHEDEGRGGVGGQAEVGGGGAEVAAERGAGQEAREVRGCDALVRAGGVAEGGGVQHVVGYCCGGGGGERRGGDGVLAEF